MDTIVLVSQNSFASSVSFILNIKMLTIKNILKAISQSTISSGTICARAWKKLHLIGTK
jgi:hypothetical protein